MNTTHTPGRRPTSNMLRIAALWLEVYDGTGADAQACAAVAAWLNEQADAAELRAECKAAGVPVARARAAIARATQEA